MSSETAPPRGWYPDPAGSPAWRWWDGERWTTELQPFGAADPTLPDLIARETEAGDRLVRIGLPLLILALVLRFWLSVTSLDFVASQLHWAKTAFVAAVHHTTLPAQPENTVPAWHGAVNLLIQYPAYIVGLVFLLRYQHRAAKAARALGLGERPSPGLGVGGWFIPIAQLWIPLRAWLHLCTPRSGERTRIWCAWAALVVAISAQITGSAMTMVSVGWARGILGLGLAADLGALVLLPGLVRDIGAVHRRAGGAPQGEREVGSAL